MFGLGTSVKKADDALGYMYITVAGQILYACAIVLLFFVYLPLDLGIATGLALFALLAGSLACWRNRVAAESVFVLSLLFIEAVVLGYFSAMLVPFIVLDAIVLGWLAGIGMGGGKQ